MKTFFAFIGFGTCCLVAYSFYMSWIGNDLKAAKEEREEARKRMKSLIARINAVDSDSFDSYGDYIGGRYWVYPESMRNSMRDEVEEIRTKYGFDKTD